jgi:hypothetical protein
VGWRVAPRTSEFVQSPAPPFAGGADASHVVAPGFDAAMT